MILGKEVEDLHDDGFDGSINENRVFSSILRGDEVDKTGKTDAPKPIPNSHSYLMGHSLPMENEVGETGNMMKLSDNKSMEGDKNVQFLLVESSSQGVISTHHLLTPLSGESDSNCKQGEDGKLVKAIASPLSEENVVNELTEDKSKKTSLALPNDPQQLLRDHVHELILAAGWKIGRVQRKDSILGPSVYISPDGEQSIRRIARVWITCGEKLLADGGVVSAHNNYEKKWNDVDEFWNDLFETLEKMEEASSAAETPQTTAALAGQWIFLNPFIKFVFIDKKFRFLKSIDRKSTRRISSSTAAKNKTLNASKNNGSLVQLFENNPSEIFLSNVTPKTVKNRPTKGQLMVKNKYCTPMKNREGGNKGSCRLLLNTTQRHVKSTEEKWYKSGERTILSWLIGSRFVSLNDIVQYRKSEDDNVVIKEGLITREGIYCTCCSRALPLSKFKQHSGLRSNCLFMKYGKPFTLCQLDAWSAEYYARKAENRIVKVEDIDENDDSCGLCGDGGELICCDNCPSTFHFACLDMQASHEGSWYCWRCSCKACGHLVNESSGVLKCSQCDHKYHKACLNVDATDEEMSSNIWFCGQSCEEIYMGLHSLMGHSNDISHEFSWSLLKCINGDKIVSCADHEMALMVECNSKLAVALTIIEECFLPMLDPRTGINMIPHLVYSWGSEFARLDYHGFYTVILQKEDVVTAVALIRIHGARVAEMPLIATCNKYRQQGMCRRIMDCIEEMLHSLKVETFVISAVPSLVKTWVNSFGFEHMEANERMSLSNVNLMVFPGTIWLKKQIYDTKLDLQEGSDPDESLNFMELSNEEIASLRDDGAGGEPIVDTGDEGDVYGGDSMDFDDEEDEDSDYVVNKSSPSE